MQHSTFWTTAGAVAIAAIVAIPAAAQDWPTKPVRVLTGSAGGGASDIVGRVFGEYFERTTGQPWIMDNRPGAATTVAAEAARTADPDGYTFFVTQVGLHGVVPNVFMNLPFDPVADFAPVARFTTSGNAFFTRKENAQIQSIHDLVAAAKANPGGLSYGVSGVATTTNLSVAMLGLREDLSFLMVPYQSSADTIVAMLRGDTDFSIENVQVVAGYSEQVRPLAVTSGSRSPALPDVPTMQELGFEGFDLSAWFGLIAPKDTPPAIIEAMAAHIKAASEDPATLERIRSLGSSPGFMAPQEFGDFIVSEIAKWGEIVDGAGIPKQ